MKTIQVRASKAYNVLIGNNLLENAGYTIKEVTGTGKIAVITDDVVDSLFSDKLISSLNYSGFEVFKKVFKNGEAIKTPENAFNIVNFLSENLFTRSDTIIALGGGTVGDLAGFAASIYLRGIKVVQIPTTLLAAVDSSVGGKTAVNLNTGKNLAGSFYQPDLVVCDIDTLSTLPEHIFYDGCAEVIKYGVIKSKALFEKLVSGIKDNLEDIISECVSIKRDIVEKDEQDKGLRQLLNFGHTTAHAIERKTDFSISHGRAVAIGMVSAAKYAYKNGFCKKNAYEQITSLIKQYYLPFETDLSVKELFETALSDKKRDKNRIALILPERIGKAVIKTITTEELYDFFKLGLGD